MKLWAYMSVMAAFVLPIASTGWWGARAPQAGNGARTAVARQYIERYKALAISQMHKYGVPASVTMAQACLESAYGQSALAKNGNNHFGIKCHAWTGRKTYVDDDEQGECFRVYQDAEASFEDHSLFLVQNARYRGLFAPGLTPRQWAQGLQQAGYATDPTYATRLIGLMTMYDLTALDSLPAVVGAMAAPGGEGDVFTLSLGREVYTCNKTSYILAQRGDTWASLAKRYKLFRAELIRFNDVADGGVEPIPGERIYIERKRRRAARGYRLHRATEGETYRDLAQAYGVRLKVLTDRNATVSAHILHEGELVLLR